MMIPITAPMLPQEIVAIKKFFADLDWVSATATSPRSFAPFVSADFRIPIIPEN